MSKVSIKNFKVVTNDFDVSDPDVKKLLPTVNISQTCTLEIHNANNAISNALRRAAMSEIPVKIMNFKIESLSTNNPFILVDMIQSRIKAIPIKQMAPNDALYDLFAVNETAELRSVYSSELVAQKSPKNNIFNETFEICTLAPKQFIKISNIYIDTNYGYHHSAHTVAFHSATTALTEEPYNEFTKTGIPSAQSTEHAFMWRFDTNGTIHPTQIIHLTCDVIISRLRAIIPLLDNIIASNDTYILDLNNESATIGNLLMKTILEMYPDITFVTFTQKSIDRAIVIKLRTDDEPNAVMSSAIKYLIDVFNNIKSQIVLKD